MGWVYLTDHFDEHLKVLEARQLHVDAPWLFVAGLCYCRRNATKGLIIAPQIPRLVSRYKPAAKDALLAVTLWDDAGAGAVVVHDFDQWNRTNEERGASARNAAQIRWKRERERRARDSS